jgi:hypothetical protein
MLKYSAFYSILNQDFQKPILFQKIVFGTVVLHFRIKTQMRARSDLYFSDRIRTSYGTGNWLMHQVIFLILLWILIRTGLKVDNNSPDPQHYFGVN